MNSTLVAVAAVSAAFVFASPFLAFGLVPGGAITAVVVGIGGMVALAADFLATFGTR
jgi:hypothetical protein